MLLCCWLFHALTTIVLASPIIPPPPQHLLPRNRAIINNVTGVAEVFSPSTGQLIPQGSASDGGGRNFSPAAALWITFCFLVGIPIALAGIRGWRLTTGVGIGLAAAVCCTPLYYFLHLCSSG
jgi:hypothetical protein